MSANGHAPASDDADYSDPEVVRSRFAAVRVEISGAETAFRDVFKRYVDVETHFARVDERTARIESLLEPLAVRIGRLDGEREVTISHIRKARRDIAQLQLADKAHREKLDSVNDEVTETGRRVAMSEDKAELHIKDALTEFELKLTAKELAEVKAGRERDAEREKNHAHAWRHFFADKSAHAAGATVLLLIGAITYLLIHGSPIAH